MSVPHSRKWYVHDRLADDYVRVSQEGGDLMMLKALKILRAIIVNLGMVGLAAFSIQQGAEPTLIGTLGVASLGLYNGVEIMDYISLLQAVQEVDVDNSDK